MPECTNSGLFLACVLRIGYLTSQNSLVKECTLKYPVSNITRRLLCDTAGAALIACYGTTALAATPKDTLVIAAAFDDIITMDPAESFEISAGEVMRRHPATLPALKASDFSVGTRVAGLFSAPFVAEQGREAQDVLKFTTASQAVFERSGESVNWRIADGHLQIDLANTSMRYTALGKGALGEDRWLIEQLNANGGATAIREIGVVPVQALNLDRAFWVRKWQSDIGASAAEPIVFRFREDALSAATSTPRGMASVPIDFRRYWHRLDDGRIEIVSARNPDCIVFRPDGSPGPVACVLTQRRSWTPVAQQGKTTWVLQNGPVLTGQPETAATWRLVALTQARGN